MAQNLPVSLPKVIRPFLFFKNVGKAALYVKERIATGLCYGVPDIMKAMRRRNSVFGCMILFLEVVGTVYPFWSSFAIIQTALTCRRLIDASS